MNDYLHNLRMLCSEDPNNDMVMPPTQSIPGIEAVLGALQAQGTPQQQQQELLRLANAARQNPGQLAGQTPGAGLNLQLLNQQQNQQRLASVLSFSGRLTLAPNPTSSPRLLSCRHDLFSFCARPFSVVQNYAQGVPLQLQGLGTDFANRYPAGWGQNVLGSGQGAAVNPLAYSQALNNLGSRQLNQVTSLSAQLVA